jgi:hypothetical protein
MQVLADFLDGCGSTGLGVADAFVNCSESFLVFILGRGGRNTEVESLRLRHILMIPRIEMWSSLSFCLDEIYNQMYI